MSLYGEWKAATIPGADTTHSAEVDLGREYDYLEIIIPTLNPSCTLKIQVAEKTGETDYDLGDSVTTTAGTHNYADIFPLFGFQFITVVTSEAQTGGDKLIRVRGMRF